MLTRIVLSVFALFLLPAFAFADWSDTDYYDDDTEEDVYTCQDLCEMAEECGNDCVPGDCAAYCTRFFSAQDVQDCASYSACPHLNLCLCGLAQDAGADAGVIGDDDDNDDGCGCHVSKSKSGFALTFIMLMIGILALTISMKAKSTS